MIKNQHLKSQLITSSIISLVIMIFGATYLFYSINVFTSKNEEILNSSQEKLYISTSINTQLKELIHANIESAQNATNKNTQIIKNLNKSLSKDIERLESIEKIANHVLVLKNHINELIHASENPLYSNVDDLINYWTAQDQNTLTVVNDFIKSVVDNRVVQIKDNESDFDTDKIIIIVLISLVIIFISFTFYRVIQTLQQLKETTDDLTKINNEYVTAKYKIENSNWILEKSSLISDGISGLDDEREICEVVIDILNKNIKTPAIALYVRKPDSFIFRLCAAHGVNKDAAVNEFISGDGYLGKITEDKEIVILENQPKEHLNIQSAVVRDNNYTIIYCPLIHDDTTLGVIEIAISDYNEDNCTLYKDYFTRISRNIATRIKFGQSHLLVQELLDETQRQTEELEAQQEELRITNEELVHKTNLLESSEEELRVQQEELTQTNIELNKKAEELETRNQDLNQTQKLVEQKIQEVELASKYKSEFMANMSHELRTPLNSILILAKLLQDNKHQNLNKEQVKYAKVIHDAGADLLQLINELLDLAKIEAGHVDLNMAKIKTKDFVHDAEDLFKAIAKDKNITFTTSIANEVPIEFLTDEYRLQQVIKNFLSNAFKFTESEGKVELNVSMHSNNLYFDVVDSGKGISQEKQDLIFEAFRQEDGSTSRKYGGTGLGLSISKEIASLLGGRIALESEIGKGSKFSLIIPVQSADEKEIVVKDNIISKTPITPKKDTFEAVQVVETPKTVPHLAGEDKTILIIEDDINFADILKGFAEDYGFNVILAHDGAKGIELAKSQLPSAIILDVMLPIADGWEVLRTLKDDESTKHIPIHMMSAATFSKKDFIENGAIGFMHKPVTEDTIQKTFENININLNKSVKKILLVEDQELQSDHIKNSFSGHNINVIQTFSLSSAWSKLTEEENIDCIILDLSLPDGNGLDLIEKIKERESLSQIPIIINTAYELPKQQYDKIISDARATILKSDKSSDRLIDEVNLFLNKLNSNAAQPAKSIPTITQTNNLNGKRVLIADDDMRNVFALSTSLQSYDMKIEIANNGQEAIDILKNPDHKVDIVLMDIMMPEMDGYEAIQIIREELKYKNLPILAVTAKAMKGDREKSIQIGANDYVSKPIDIDKLTSLMQVWLG
ncbi:MAG: response regulator [Sphingobacterium composti]|uniref:hybrid sensor histidine kinase/response regulator n=1 Tax=Sphingobacterium composti TaxID=363260 RepID=UPI00135C732B|nr:response regulator [Sphingobacterium composti Ten et al. 2007 non Yoo et al. 2007]